MPSQNAKIDPGTRSRTLLAVNSSGEIRRLLVDSNDYLYVNGIISTGDIEIGAVELKNATSDDRATVSANGALSVLDTNSTAILTAVQSIDTDTSTIISSLSSIDTSNTAIAASAAIIDDWNATQGLVAPLNSLCLMGEAKDFDGSALPNTVSSEGQSVRIATTLSGIQYVMVVNEDGSYTSGALDDSAQVSTPAILNVGGEYRASATTYTDGDAAILQQDVNGYLKVATAGTSNYENASYAETEAIATKSEFTSAGLYGYDLDAASPVLRAVQVAVDNATVSATPNVLVAGGIYKNADDTYDDNDAVPFHFNVNGALKVSTEEAQGTAPQAYGIDAVGADTYITIVTATAARYHMSVSLQGANNAIVSLDSGTTEHFYIPANSAHVFDNIVIASGATVQAKNASAGNNYTNLAITIW